MGLPAANYTTIYPQNQLMSKDIFENLVNDITAEVLQQVQQQVVSVVAAAVSEQINSLLSPERVNAVINTRVVENLHNYRPDTTQIEQQLEQVGAQVAESLHQRANSLVEHTVNARVNEIDFSAMILNQLSAKLDPSHNKYPFMERSIDITAVDTDDLVITGDQVVGGVIRQFASTGIDDRSTMCQVTVMDQGTVFENTLYAPRIEIKGGAKIDGDLEIQGRIVDNAAYQQLVSAAADQAQETIKSTVLDQHQDRIFERIHTEGIDLSKISLDGRLIVDGQKLLNVFYSQLQTVGTLRDLQTDGETLLSQSLYVGNQRVGVNTMNPTVALDIWDDEVEIRIGKQQQGVARIATAKDHTLIIGSNDQDNITVTPDGAVTVQQIRIGNVLVSSSANPPQYTAQRGTIVFNEQPNLGGPIGWVSLGDARWANFGIID